MRCRKKEKSNCSCLGWALCSLSSAIHLVCRSPDAEKSKKNRRRPVKSWRSRRRRLSEKKSSSSDRVEKWFCDCGVKKWQGYGDNSRTSVCEIRPGRRRARRARSNSILKVHQFSSRLMWPSKQTRRRQKQHKRLIKIERMSLNENVFLVKNSTPGKNWWKLLAKAMTDVGWIRRQDTLCLSLAG